MIPTNPPPTFRKPELWSDDFTDFVKKCLVKNPEQRATATQLLQVSAYVSKGRIFSLYLLAFWHWPELSFINSFIYFFINWFLKMKTSQEIWIDLETDLQTHTPFFSCMFFFSNFFLLFSKFNLLSAPLFNFCCQFFPPKVVLKLNFHRVLISGMSSRFHYYCFSFSYVFLPDVLFLDPAFLLWLFAL